MANKEDYSRTLELFENDSYVRNGVHQNAIVSSTETGDNIVKGIVFFCLVVGLVVAIIITFLSFRYLIVTMMG